MATNLKGLLILTVLSAALIFTGCSENAPLGPAADNDAQLSKSILPLTDAKIDGTSATVEVEVDVTAIDGGVIEVVSDYTHNFIVSSESISKDVEITVKYSKEVIYGKKMAVFEFGPSGLIFKEAAHLEYDMAELNKAARIGKLFYFDPDLRIWTIQDGMRVVDGKVDFEIHHFSKYAISD